MSDHPSPQLGNTSTDLIASVSKGALGAVPLVGSLIAEVVGNIIPNQRVDRIARFVELLHGRLSEVEEHVLRAKLTMPEVVDVLEDAFTQAARATSPERLERIASVVAHGISPEALNQAETKRMLWLLSQLSDEEVVLLRSRLALTNEDFAEDAEFRSKHEALLAPIAPHMGSGEDEFDDATLRTSYRQHLIDLRLLRPRFKRPKRGDFPEFDEKTGMMKSSGTDVTSLGRMLLEYLDLIPDWYARRRTGG